MASSYRCLTKSRGLCVQVVDAAALLRLMQGANDHMLALLDLRWYVLCLKSSTLPHMLALLRLVLLLACVIASLSRLLECKAPSPSQLHASVLRIRMR